MPGVSGYPASGWLMCPCRAGILALSAEVSPLRPSPLLRAFCHQEQVTSSASKAAPDADLQPCPVVLPVLGAALVWGGAEHVALGRRPASEPEAVGAHG